MRMLVWTSSCAVIAARVLTFAGAARAQDRTDAGDAGSATTPSTASAEGDAGARPSAPMEPPPSAPPLPSAPHPAPPPPAQAAVRDPDEIDEDERARPPLGRPAPPTEAATHGKGPVRVGAEVFAEYGLVRTLAAGGASGSTFHQFDLPRAHAALEGATGPVRGRVVLEAVRSASEGALIGVAGDSLTLRLREAYGGYRPTFFPSLEAAAGVVPALTIPELDGTWMMRAVAPSALERHGVSAPADLGARLKADLPRDYGYVAVVAANGEGYARRELNRGKNVEGAFELHPLAKTSLRPLALFGSFVEGSSGTASARAHRATAGLLWQGVVVRAGLVGTHAWGVGDRGAQRAIVASAFLRVEPVRRLMLGARFDHVRRSTSARPVDAISEAFLTVGYRIATPLELFLVGSRSVPTTRAEAELVSANHWSARAVARVVF